MQNLPKHGVIHLADGSARYLKHLQKESELLVGHTEIGKSGTTVTIPFNNIAEIVAVSEERVSRLQAIDRIKDRLIDPTNAGTEMEQEYRSDMIAPHLAPTPTSDNEEINQWYRHLCNLRKGERVIFQAKKDQRKHPLTLTSNPEFGESKPVVEVEMKGIRDGEYRVRVDAEKGSANAWSKEGEEWTWKRPITEIYVLLSQKTSGEMKIDFNK